MEDRSHWPEIVLRGKKALREFDSNESVRNLTPGERIAMAWPLAKMAYTLAGYDLSQVRTLPKC